MCVLYALYNITLLTNVWLGPDVGHLAPHRLNEGPGGCVVQARSQGI
jgi:hypothetical protein